MLSEEAYTLSNEGKILFTAGSKSASLTVTVKRNKLSYGNYVLPLKMTHVARLTLKSILINSRVSSASPMCLMNRNCIRSLCHVV